MREDKREDIEAVRAGKPNVTVTAAGRPRLRVVNRDEKRILLVPEGTNLQDPVALRAILDQAALQGIDPEADVDAIDVERPDRPITRGEIVESCIRAMHSHVRAFRVEPMNPDDPFDYSGAAAALAESMELTGRPPRDDVADLYARAVVTARRLDHGVRRGIAQSGLAEPDDLIPWIKDASERIAFSLAAAAAWARDGFPTYDLTAGLWEVLRHSLDDPGVAAMPIIEAVSPRPAFALRLPGPDYPGIEGHEVRGLLIYTFADCPNAEEHRRMVEAMHESLPEDDAALLTRKRAGEARHIYEDLSAAGHSALPVDTVPAFLVILAGYVPRPRTGRHVGTCLEQSQMLTRLGKNPRLTVSEAVKEALGDVAVRPDGFHEAKLGVTLEPVYRELMAAAVGASLYLKSVQEDPGHPVRSKPVRMEGGVKVVPDRRVLGRGVKSS